MHKKNIMSQKKNLKLFILIYNSLCFTLVVKKVNLNPVIVFLKYMFENIKF